GPGALDPPRGGAHPTHGAPGPCGRADARARHTAADARHHWSSSSPTRHRMARRGAPRRAELPPPHARRARPRRRRSRRDARVRPGRRPHGTRGVQGRREPELRRHVRDSDGVRRLTRDPPPATVSGMRYYVSLEADPTATKTVAVTERPSGDL